MSRCHSRGVFRIAVVALLFALLGLGAAPAAHAHPTLVGSTPSDGQTLSKAPDRLRLVFSEPVILSSVRLELRSSAGAVRLLTAGVEAAVHTRVSAPLPSLGQDVYEVR